MCEKQKIKMSEVASKDLISKAPKKIKQLVYDGICIWNVMNKLD